MKKILTLAGIMALSMNLSFAYINETEVSGIDNLRFQGYSESMLRIVDMIKYKKQGPGGNYKKRFVMTPRKGPFDTAYTAIKVLFDPMQDDDLFGEHQINFTNTWNGEEAHYTTRKVEVVEEQIEDL